MAAASTRNPYQRLHAAKDKGFSANSLAQYHLSICVSDTHLKISCINPNTAQCMLLETYSLAPDRDDAEGIKAVEMLCQDHPLLAEKGWGATTLSVANQCYTLVPKQLFQEKKAGDYLKFSCALGANVVNHFTHTSLNVAVAFTMNPARLAWFKAAYGGNKSTIMHQASSIMAGAEAYIAGHQLEFLPKVFVFVEANHMHITVIQKNSLLYYNRFAYADSDQLLYYILIAMHTLQLDPTIQEVIIGGNITKKSLAYKKARNYIRQLTLSKKPPQLKFGRTFSGEVVDTYLDVLGTYPCSGVI